MYQNKLADTSLESDIKSDGPMVVHNQAPAVKRFALALSPNQRKPVFPGVHPSYGSATYEVLRKCNLTDGRIICHPHSTRVCHWIHEHSEKNLQS